MTNRRANMGFSDEVTIERAYPEYGLSAGSAAQTKSLYAGGGFFTITQDGKLVEHRYRCEEDTDPETIPRLRRVHIGDKIIAYHGDILLHVSGAVDRSQELVARFTHGQLEWLRPLEDYPEENRALLVEQGAR